MAVEEREASESQIAVHWREEDYYHRPAKFIAQANAGDPSILDRFNEERFPECFKEYAALLDWDTYWQHHARYQQSALLEVVCRSPSPGG
jgi:acetyl-CoA synthetase